MQTISIVEGVSDLFGEESSKTVSLQTTTSRMDFVIKEGNHCSVSSAMGSGREMKELTLAFIERYQPLTLVNQVHRDLELRSMYACGFRLPVPVALEHGINSMAATVEYCHQQPSHSILMALNGLTPADYNEDGER